MSDPAPALIWCPFASEEDAAAICGQLLDEGLIACANIMPAMRSLYEWQGERGDASEVGVLLKTNAALLARAIARLEQLHPYDAPAITGWETDRAGEATQAWLGALGRVH
ncbi:MAG: divalent-cation tolerance protein CutA [Oxalobacteraceae bacterium]|nr:MAG: divalent-cation tolerance protein CutA [Oxalobacteraceae bacterium]